MLRRLRRHALARKAKKALLALAATAYRRACLARALRRLRAQRAAGRRARAAAAAARAVAARATANRCVTAWKLFRRAAVVERLLHAAAAKHARESSMARAFRLWAAWWRGKRIRRHARGARCSVRRRHARVCREKCTLGAAAWRQASLHMSLVQWIVQYRSSKRHRIHRTAAREFRRLVPAVWHGRATIDSECAGVAYKPACWPRGSYALGSGARAQRGSRRPWSMRKRAHRSALWLPCGCAPSAPFDGANAAPLRSRTGPLVCVCVVNYLVIAERARHVAGRAGGRSCCCGSCARGQSTRIRGGDTA